MILGALVFTLALFTPLPIQADTPPIYIPMTLAPIQRDTPIELTALTLDADISESNGHTLIVGNSTFKLHNTDLLNDLQVPVGFPTWAGDTYTFDPAHLDSFAISIDGKKINLPAPTRADLKVGTTIRNVEWYTFTLAIAGDEKKIVRVDFQQDLGDSNLPRFTYGILPAVIWKGNLGSARLTLRFPATTTLEQVVAYDPPNLEFDGASVIWRLTSKEPTANPSLTIIRPGLWNDLQAKRRAAQQNPNDANARAALGIVLRQLALSDSAKQASFYGQAIAELEAAVRLDANNRAARQALALLYESRAGAATGPRHTAYVALAIAQWNALANSDANARKQLAEDYFYLALDAQTRGAFADAQTNFDQAKTVAPNGAGPLFTPEHLAAQERALNLAWARALIDQNNLVLATAKARAAFGDAFMNTFTPPLFYVTRAQITTASQARTMVYTLTPTQRDAAQNAITGAVAQFRAAGADADLAPDGANLTLTITLLFDRDATLVTKLDALAHAVPDQPEWSLVRASLSPSQLTWNENDGILTHTQTYREGVNLAPACNTVTAQIDALGQALAPLENASGNDDQAQLKRAWLENAQRDWQATLTNGRVTYRAGKDEMRVSACATQMLDMSSTSPQVEQIIIASIGGVLIISIGVASALIIRRRKKSANSM